MRGRDRDAHDAGKRRVPRRIRRFVHLMDEAVEIPGLGIRVGMDAMFGLLPGVGDVISGVLSLTMLVVAARMGVSGAVLGRMALNLGVDALVGAVPFLGDVFDVAFKANRRNQDLLERHLQDPEGTRRASRLVVGGVLTAFGLSLLGALVLGVFLLAWIESFFLG